MTTMRIVSLFLIYTRFLHSTYYCKLHYTVTNRRKLIRESMANNYYVIDVWHARHDLFNLTVLPLICIYTAYYLCWCTPADSGRDVFTACEYYLFTMYLLVDIVWLALIPNSVASPATIIGHHTVCLVGWWIPYHQRDMSCFRLFSSCLIVEVNTWLLIARRTFRNSAVLNTMFYFSWIAIRVFYCPSVLCRYALEHYEDIVEVDTGSVRSVLTKLVLSVMLCLCTLNLKWTYDLFSKPIRIFVPGAEDRKGL
jgi:hypothetical protein